MRFGRPRDRSDANREVPRARAMSAFHVGLDLDNTIISYDDAFGKVAAAIGLLPAGHGLRTKGPVKARLITPARGEQDWMRLQGQVYGRHIDSAVLGDGVADCIRDLRRRGARV